MKTLLTAIVLSTLPLASILDGSRYSFALFFGYVSLLLIWWQIMLGNRFVTQFVTDDLLLINKLHRFLGTYGFFILVTHYAVILSVFGLSLLTDGSFSGYSLGVKYGAFAFYLALGVWLSSALLRKRLQWDTWKSFHFAAYGVFVFGFLHSAQVGSSDQLYSSVEVMRLVMVVSFGVVALVRILQWSGLLKKRYKVVNIQSVTRGVKKITIEPTGRDLVPKPGQFAYLQHKRFDQSHPFSVSHYNKQSKQISFSIKASGDWTKQLHSKLKKGQTVFVDGPYGVFGNEIPQLEKNKVIVVAGGIGITPFLRFAQNNQIGVLFYGNQTENDVAYKTTIEKNVDKVVHVLSSGKHENYETGFITGELIKSRVNKSLNEYSFFICGPPAMMDSIQKQLIKAGVSNKNIYTERFSL